MRILAALLLLLFQTTSVLASELEIIELRNRPAEEIIPLIKPLLDAGESLTGQGFQLILKADAARQTQIRALVSKLDRAAAQLMISVFQGSERDMRALGIEAGGSVSTQGHVQVTGKVTGTRSRMQDNPVYRLRITEGTAGYIETGQSIPYFSGNFYRNNGRHLVESNVDYKDVTSGFYVRPRLSGDRVTLDISPQRESLDSSRPGAINTRRAATTISGRLGEWIPLGGTTEQATHSSKQVGTSYSTKDRHSESIWIKAEQVQ